MAKFSFRAFYWHWPHVNAHKTTNKQPPHPLASTSQLPLNSVNSHIQAVMAALETPWAHLVGQNGAETSRPASVQCNLSSILLNLKLKSCLTNRQHNHLPLSVKIFGRRNRGSAQNALFNYVFMKERGRTIKKRMWKTSWNTWLACLGMMSGSSSRLGNIVEHVLGSGTNSVSECDDSSFFLFFFFFLADVCLFWKVKLPSLILSEKKGSAEKH